MSSKQLDASDERVPPAVHATLGRAFHLQQIGRIDEAAALCSQVLEACPGSSSAMHLLGMILHQQGDTERAIGLLEQAAIEAPDDLEISNNLGNLCLIAGRATQAEALFLNVLHRDPSASSTRFNLAMLLLGTGRVDAAVDELERVALHVDDVDVWRALGEAHLRQKRFSQASDALERAVRLRPDDEELLRSTCHAYELTLDLLERSLAPLPTVQSHLQRWLRIAPDDPIARHALAAHAGADVPARCSEGYVRRTFDQFADSFDEVLGVLGYCGVTDSVAALERTLSSSSAVARERSMLDAGCGTGALGPRVRAMCAKLVGVDLSPRMLAKAEARGVYDTLVESDLETYLQREACEPCFDVVVCADTLIYFGDVRPLFVGFMRALVPWGVLVLTAEALSEPSPGVGTALNRHGRYQHSEPFLRAELEAAGATVVEVVGLPALRRENRRDVPGLVVVAQRRCV